MQGRVAHCVLQPCATRIDSSWGRAINQALALRQVAAPWDSSAWRCAACFYLAHQPHRPMLTCCVKLDIASSLHKRTFYPQIS